MKADDGSRAQGLGSLDAPVTRCSGWPSGVGHRREQRDRTRDRRRSWRGRCNRVRDRPLDRRGDGEARGRSGWARDRNFLRYRDDEAVAGVFARVAREAGRLDVLVNNATAVPALSTLFSEEPFWRVPPSLWDDLMAVGLRSHFVCAQHAVPIMLRQGRGLVVNISSAGAATKIGIVPYGVAKAALDP